MAHEVLVLAGGRLQPAAPHGRGWRYTCGADGARVDGVLIDRRWVHRAKPAMLDSDGFLDVTAAEVLKAHDRLKPLESCPRTGLQVLQAYVDPLTGSTDPFHPDNLVRVVAPGLLVDGVAETVAGWMDRTYRAHVGPRRDYERDLVVRGAAGVVLARGCRPCGLAAGGLLLVRASLYTFLVDRAGG